jgi:hemolysin activation/secretion protein
MKERTASLALLAFAPFLCAPSFALEAAPNVAKAPHFDILEYRVLGNTSLPATDVERAVYPFLGEGKSFEDIQKARDALQLAYKNHDFGTILVDIPEQDVADGVVRLRVTEGRLRTVQMTGAKYFSERKLLAGIPAAVVGAAPRLGELQREIAAVNSQSADRTVTPVLKAGPTTGTVDLSMKVQDRSPFHASVELNNQYTVGTTHLRANVSAEYSNLFNDLDDISLQYQLSPEDTSQVGVFAGGYTSGPWVDGIRGSLYYIHSSSSVPTVGALGVLGKGGIFSGRITFPLEFSAQSTQNIYIGADYKHFLESIDVDTQTSLVTPITYMNFSVGYGGGWRREMQQWSIASSVNFGIRGVVNDPDAFENKRYLAKPNYMYLREDASFTQTLPAGFTVRLRLAGQFSDMPLVSNENYSIGGADGVRGYLEAEELGDSALKGTLQIDSPAWVVKAMSGQVFVFCDAGRTEIIDPLEGQPDHADLRSVGSGLSLAAGAMFTSAVTWAYPLVNGTATRAHDSLVLFTVRGAF